MNELTITQKWYAKNSYLKDGKVVDWGLIDIRRKEYLHTGITREYLKQVGCEHLIKYNLYQEFYDEIDEEIRLYEESKKAR